MKNNEGAKLERDYFRAWLAKGTNASWVVFGLFTLLIFSQTLLFDHFAFRELARQPSALGYVAKLFSKLGAAMVIAAITFLL